MTKSDLNTLGEIKEKLQRNFVVSMRGHGLSSFLFVTNNGRAVEISKHDEGWWLQFWEAGGDEDAPANRDVTVPQTTEVVQEVIRWLA